jgi:hypothetical protein
MKGRKKTYVFRHLASSVFMILALLWLTISAPFVQASQQELSKQLSSADASSPIDNNEEETNPFGNNTEEKKPNSGNSFSEEYLHDLHADEHFFSITGRKHSHENSGVYTAFHGEVQVPPPNIA